MSKFMQYALVAAKEALDDAEWAPEDPLEQEATVSLYDARRMRQALTVWDRVFA